MREFERIGLTMEILKERGAEIDAVTPEFAQGRGRPVPEVAQATKEYLRLLREMPDAAGADAVIEHFREARQR